MASRLTELIDIRSLQALMDSLHKITGVSTGILDADGKILMAAGWLDVCVKFHRAHDRSADFCRLSSQMAKEFISKDVPCFTYECFNGLWGTAVPVLVSGEIIGSVFAGQYLTAPVNEERFKAQAERYQYDIGEYLNAVRQVPVLDEARICHIVTFFKQLAELLAQIAYTQNLQSELQSQALRESEAKYQAVINSMPGVALQSYDRQGRVIYWNKASETFFGWTADEAKGKRLEQLILDAAEGYRFRSLIRAAGIWKRQIGPNEWRTKSKDGSERIVLSTLIPIKLGSSQEFIAIDVDITEQKHLEQEIHRLDRLNLVGQLAASIGHEVRNPMTTVRGYLQLLRGKAEAQVFVRQIDIMIEELDRANAIITEFLTLARNKTINLARKNLNDIINALSPLLEAAAVTGKHSLCLKLSPVPNLLLDEKEIRQLILNLAHNGFEAMTGGGCLTVETRMTGVRDVELIIRDAGPGISPDVFERLGTPFVTTKESGTGLGLAVCYSIAARHQAQIRVESSPRGTAFIIAFKVR